MAGRAHRGEGDLAYRVLASSTVVAARGAVAAAWLTDRGGWVLGELLTQALTPDELSRLTTRLYDASHVRYSPAEGLFDWEPDWFAAHLPPAPAKLLVGGAGSGREVAPLLARGYAVDAFDAVPRFAADCAALPGIGLARCTDFASFARELLEPDGAAKTDFAATPYDAVILGWCSLDHVLVRADRERLLRAACAAAPHGPVLASFHALECEATTPTSAPGRAAAAGKRLGRLLRAARKLDDAHVGASLVWHAGFAHYTTRAEIEALAAVVGRRVVCETDAHGRAAFLA